MSPSCSVTATNKSSEYGLNLNDREELSSSQPGADNHGRVRHLIKWGLLLLPFLTVALWHMPDGPGLKADDYGQYLMHARALVEGRPYADIGYIYSPFRYGIGPATAPPGLPVTLAAVYAIFGLNMTIMRLLMLAFAVVFVLVSALYFARQDDWRLGAGVALLCGLSPDVAYSSTQLLTDLPFAALVWLVIYVVDKPGRMTAARIIAVTALGIAAAAFRVPAAALFPALLLFTVLRYREHGFRPAIPLLVWLLGFALLTTVIPLERISAVRLHRIVEWNLAEGTSNLRAYWSAVFESHLHPFPWSAANDAFHVITGLVMCVGLLAWVRKAFTKFGTLFLLTYAAMLLLLPLNSERYLWPLFPFLVFGLLNGVRIIASLFIAGVPERASQGALVFALVLVPPAMIRTMIQPRRGDLMAEPAVQDVVRAIRASAAHDSARVVFYKPRSFAWSTGLPAMGAIGGTPECLISELTRGRITHVITGGVTMNEESVQQRSLTQLTRARPDLFVPLRRSAKFNVYRFQVNPAEAASARKQCRGP